MDVRISEMWLRGEKTPEEREKIKKLVLSNDILLDKLKKIMYNMQVEKRKSVLGDYDTPSWSHKQAHLNGELAVLDRLMELVTITERDDQPKP